MKDIQGFKSLIFSPRYSITENIDYKKKTPEAVTPVKIDKNQIITKYTYGLHIPVSLNEINMAPKNPKLQKNDIKVKKNVIDKVNFHVHVTILSNFRQIEVIYSKRKYLNIFSMLVQL